MDRRAGQCCPKAPVPRFCEPPRETFATEVSGYRVPSDCQKFAALIGTRRCSGDIHWLQWGTLISDRLVTFKIYPDHKRIQDERRGYVQYEYNITERLNIVRIGVFSCEPDDYGVASVNVMPGCEDMAVIRLERMVPCNVGSVKPSRDDTAADANIFAGNGHPHCFFKGKFDCGNSLQPCMYDRDQTVQWNTHPGPMFYPRLFGTHCAGSCAPGFHFWDPGC